MNKCTSLIQVVKFLFVSIGFLVLLPKSSAQTVVLLNNPSSCDTSVTRRIRDFTCPENSGFFQPNLFNIRVNGAEGTALGRDVYLKELRLRIKHTWAADLKIQLISPSGRKVEVSRDNGGGGDNYGVPGEQGCGGYMTFLTGACVSITDGKAPFMDRPYAPEETFLNLNDNSTNPNGTWQLRICDDTEQDTGRLEFVELVFAPLTCLPVETFSLLSQDTTAATLTWTPNQGCASGTVTIEYGPKGFTPGTGAAAGQGRVVTANCPPYILRGLAADTEYEVYLRRNCGSLFSANSCAISFKSGCQPPGPTTLETFNAEFTCDPFCDDDCTPSGVWRNGPGSNMPWLVYTGPTPTEDTGPNTDVSGTGKYVYIETTGNQCSTGAQAWLQSGCFRLNKRSTDSCHFSFFYHQFGANAGTLRLEISTNGGVTWQNLWERRGNQGDAWRKVSLSLRSFVDGTIVQFRFVGIKGNGSLGDIALDQIAVHGSEYLGWPSAPYYLDADSDGFGNPNRFIWSCAATPPAGYVNNRGDCNDQNSSINAGQTEIPCDNIDQNCNGNADDALLPPPFASGDTICSGQTAILRAIPPRSGDFLLWFNAPTGGQSLGSGATFSPVLPANTGATPVLHRFYVEAVDNNLRCASGGRREVIVRVLPLPSPVLAQQPEICALQSFDLRQTKLQDAHYPQSSLAFYRNTPLNASNLLSNTVVAPVGNTRYFFEFTSPEGCKNSGEFTLAVNPIPALSFSPADSFSLCLEAQQVLTVTARSSTAPYRYLWNNGAETPSITINAGAVPGVRTRYSVQVTDAKGCVTIRQALMVSSSSIDSIRRIITPVTTCNGRNGRISLQPLSGQAPFRYRWTGPNGITGDSTVRNSNAFVIENLPQGSYQIAVSDNSPRACQFNIRNAVVNGPAVEVRDIGIRSVTCGNTRDGAIVLDVRGTAKFKWSNGDTISGSGITGLAGGTYAVTITSGTCQSVLNNLVVRQPDSIRIVANLVSPKCQNTREGIIDLNVFGGRGSYQYRWSSGQNTEDLFNLSRGAYTVTVTDASGCTQTRSFELSGPPLLTAVVDSTKAVTCAGRSDGSLRVSGRGGTAPYQYNWANGLAGPVLRNLPSGSYSLTVTDAAGCSIPFNAIIGSAEPLRARIVQSAAPKCLGDTTGQITTAVTGGTAPYRFAWTNGATTANLRSLKVGTYAALVTDRNGCTTDSIKVGLSALAGIRARPQIASPACLGLATGGINLRPQGQAPFRFRWSNGDTTAFTAGLGVGKHSVNIRDALGCSLDTTISIAASTQPIQANFAISSPTCSNTADGFVNVQMLRIDNPPIQYMWENGTSVEDRFNLPSGLYGITITDRLGCKLVRDSIKLEQPSAINYQVAGIGQVLCSGDSTGFIELAISGGRRPYRVAWEGSKSTQPSAYKLKAGDYRAFITDGNGCPITGDFKITQPSPLRAETQTQVNNTTCDASRFNTIRAVVSGGTGPYTYRWSNGATTSALANVVSGNYNVTVSDANGCSVATPLLKLRDSGEPIKLLEFKTRDISCFGQRNGEVSATITGGLAPYTFFFNNFGTPIVTNQATAVIRNLPVDNDYRVLIVDAKGCQVSSETRSINEPSLLNIRRDSLRNLRCGDLSNGAIFITPRGGTPPYAFNWYQKSNNRQVAVTEDLIGVGAGTFYVVVTDSRICLDTLEVGPLNASAPIRLASSSVTDIRCQGDASGSITVTVEGGRQPYRYAWNGRTGNRILSNVRAGTYQLQVTDADSCKISFPAFLIREPSTQGLTVLDTLSEITCNGGNNGAISIGISGGKGPYRWSWQNPQGQTFGIDTRRIQQLRAGTYTLNLSDADNCTRVIPYNVVQPLPIQTSFDLLRPKAGQNDGSIRANVRGGTQPYRYQWSNGATTNQILGLAAGNYTLTITDNRNCRQTETVVLMTSAILDPDLVKTVKLYPNPAQDYIVLEAELSQAKTLFVQIQNLDGKVLRSQVVDSGPKLLQQFSLKDLPAGTYFFRALSERRVVFSGRFVVLRE
jgi:subtilisin-like proprotein convertase family protein